MQATVPADLPTRDILDAAMGVLMGYVSKPTAQSILNVARQRTGVTGAQLTREQLRDMLDALERSLLFYVGDPNQARSCRRALEGLASPTSGPAHRGALVLKIRVEDDVARARSEARQLAVVLGCTQVGQTRLMTAVSELARNIVQYAGGGEVELTPVSKPAGVQIVATDRGPGIPNLDRIMTGNYRSRLGMGLGLRGVKKLAERFDVRTEPGRGTTVSALLKVV
jgi:serine/threonine-protein kinase RsbT